VTAAFSAWRAGVWAGMGPQAPAMMATFLAFGAACREADMPLSWMLAACLLIYGMPGQLILLGVPGMPGVLGATVANARFLPLAIALGPYLGPRGWLAAPFIAVTPWAVAIRTVPGLHPGLGLPWFLGCGGVSWGLGAAAALLGFWVAADLPAAARPALLFASTCYFALLIGADVLRPAARPAVLGGIVAAPLAILLPPAVGLLAAGLIGGTAAWLWQRRR